MHILVIEGLIGGHHSVYLKKIVEGYINDGHEVTVTCLETDLKHPDIISLKETHKEFLNFFLIDDRDYHDAFGLFLGDVCRELSLRRIFRDAYRSIHREKPVDYVFLPYLDYCMYAIGLLGSPFGTTQWGGICMRPSFHYSNFGVISPKPKMAKIKQALFMRLLRSKTLKSVYTIDELLHSFVSYQNPQWAHQIKYVPDPAELNGNHTYESARRELGIPEEAIVVLVYGAIDGRKGMDVLVETLVEPDVSKDFHLLIVGKQSDSIQQFMNYSKFINLVKEKRCHVINEFANEYLQQIVFAASDVVWLGYKNHYVMSGVLVLAGLSYKPVITKNEGLLGWYTKNKKIGVLFEDSDGMSLRLALEKILSKEKRQEWGVNSYNTFKNNQWYPFLRTIKI